MKSQLPALIMLLSEFWKPIEARDVARRDVYSSPTEALALTQPLQSMKPAIFRRPCPVAHYGLEAKRNDSDKADK